MLRDMQSQTIRLTALVDDLLIVSELDRAELDLKLQIFDPNAFLTHLIRNFQSSTSSHKIVSAGNIAQPTDDPR